MKRRAGCLDVVAREWVIDGGRWKVDVVIEFEYRGSDRMCQKVTQKNPFPPAPIEKDNGDKKRTGKKKRKKKHLSSDAVVMGRKGRNLLTVFLLWKSGCPIAFP